MFSMEAVTDAARATLSRQSSVSPTTPHAATSNAGAGGDGRLSAFVGGGDVDALQSAMAARSTTVGGVAKTVWSRTAAVRHKGAQQGGGGSTPGTKQLSAPSGNPARTLSPNVRPLSPAPTPSSGQRIALNHLSVEETIHCRTVFDRHTTLDTALSACHVGGGGGGGMLAEPSGIQSTVHCALDIFSVTALLHHCRILPSVPTDVELRRIILRVAIANATVVAKPTKSVAASAAAVEAVVEFPTELTFPLFLQLVELAKRWLIREDDEDEAARAFAFLSKNRKYIKAVDEAAVQSILSSGKWSNVQQMLGLNSAAASSMSVNTHAISPSMFDLEGNGSFVLGGSGGGVAGASQASHGASSLSVSHLQDVLSIVGATYDFDTLFASVDPTFEKGTTGSKIDQRLFRWIAGVDDPDIVRAFMSLGGEEALSGTITVDRLIAKCEAMQMTPQYIANFIALVDPNQDGVVDFTEFLSLLVRNRQELSGERKSKLTERGTDVAYGGFRFGATGPHRAEVASTPTTDAKNGLPVSPSLPFPRQKRFSRYDTAAESAAARRASVLPFQGLDEEDVDGAERNHLAFQEKVRSIFSGADAVLLEDDEDDNVHSPLDPPPQTVSNSKCTDSGDLNDSFASGNSEDESPRTRATKKRMSIQETHLGIGLAGMLQGKTERPDRPPVTLTERLDMAVKKGTDAIAQQRSRVDAAMHELEKRKQRKFIRTDDGLVEGNREGGESAMQQRNRMKVLRAERASRRATANARPLSARVVAMSEQAVTQLQRDVHRLLSQAAVPSQPLRAAIDTRPASEAAADERHDDRAADVEGGRCVSQQDVGERLRGPHKTSRMFRSAARALSPRTVPNNDGKPSDSTGSGAHDDVGIKLTQADNIILVRPPTATPRPRTPAVISSRPSTAASMRACDAVTRAPQRPCESAVPSLSTGNPSSSTPEEAYRKVKLEDPLSLWKLLDTNRRRLNRDHAVATDTHSNDIRPSGYVQEGMATRRAFARTIASHLALRQSFEDDQFDVCGARTPAAIHQAYILGAPQPKPQQRPGSNQHYRTTTAAANSTNAASTPRKQPHRPQTAPSLRRPVSARTSQRDAQLNRATNQSPHAPSMHIRMSLSRPTSAVSTSGGSGPKQYGVGGLLDIDDAGDECEEVVYV